jgi:hypothetical protein
MDASDAINLVRVKHELCLFIVSRLVKRNSNLCRCQIKILRRSRTKIISSEEQLHIIQRYLLRLHKIFLVNIMRVTKKEMFLFLR